MWPMLRLFIMNEYQNRWKQFIHMTFETMAVERAPPSSSVSAGLNWAPPSSTKLFRAPPSFTIPKMAYKWTPWYDPIGNKDGNGLKIRNTIFAKCARICQIILFLSKVFEIVVFSSVLSFNFSYTHIKLCISGSLQKIYNFFDKMEGFFVVLGMQNAVLLLLTQHNCWWISH